jgi:hypothetical protein
MLRSTIRLVLICCVFVSIEGAARVTHAQHVASEPGIQALRPQTVLRPLSSAFRASPIPIRIERIEVPHSVLVGDPFSATVLANVESASLPLRVRWDMGDGDVLEGLSIRHRYERAGSYSVVLRIQNPAGEEVRRLRIHAVPDPQSRSDHAD